MIEPARDEFEALKRASFAQVLFKAARLVNDDGLERLRATTGQAWIRAAHTNLFPHISFEGIRLTELASRLGITKQAVQVLVDDLVEAGAVERVPDPADGRAKLLRWSEEGRRGLLDGLSVLKEVERDLERVVGVADLATAHRALLAIVDHLDERESR